MKKCIVSENQGSASSFGVRAGISRRSRLWKNGVRSMHGYKRHVKNIFGILANGFEPLTFRLRTWRSTKWSVKHLLCRRYEPSAVKFPHPPAQRRSAYQNYSDRLLGQPNIVVLHTDFDSFLTGIFRKDEEIHRLLRICSLFSSITCHLLFSL